MLKYSEKVCKVLQVWEVCVVVVTLQVVVVWLVFPFKSSLAHTDDIPSGLFVQVEGTAVGRDSNKDQLIPEEEENTEASSTTNSSPSSFLNGIANLLSGSPQPQSTAAENSDLLQCPCDIVATVKEEDCTWEGNKLLPLDFIQGTGVVRVVYADPKLRILESPHQNNGGWEDQGLITVQVREDLLSSQ